MFLAQAYGAGQEEEMSEDMNEAREDFEAAMAGEEEPRRTLKRS